VKSSAPDRTRTCDRRFRKPLCPLRILLRIKGFRNRRNRLGVLLGAFGQKVARLGVSCRVLGYPAGSGPDRYCSNGQGVKGPAMNPPENKSPKTLPKTLPGVVCAQWVRCG